MPLSRRVRSLESAPKSRIALRVAVPWLADLYLRGVLKLDELISERYPLARINDALETLERGEALRNVVVL